MYELIKINDNDSYVDMPSKAGVIRINDGICLIDSGNDKDAAKKILKVIDGDVKWILNTHSHADHMGGNKVIQDRTGCRIFVPGMEKAIAENTIFEPLMLYGGRPLNKLENKFLMAKPCMAEDMYDIDEVSMISLPGHSPSMTAYITKDRTAYVGDCITSKEILDKYGIGYTYDIEMALSSMEKLKTIDADAFVPAHAEVTSDIEKLADYNIMKMLEAGDRILSFCRESITFEEILKKVLDSYELELTLQQYALIGSTVRAYLTWFNEKGEIDYSIHNNRMYWRKK